MPTYEFKCQECNTVFTKVLSISQRSSGMITCESCGSTHVDQLFTSISVKADKKTW